MFYNSIFAIVFKYEICHTESNPVIHTQVCTCTHTHSHAHISTQTYPSSTSATQQTWWTGFNFLAPRLGPSLMHFSSPPACFQPAAAPAQLY